MLTASHMPMQNNGLKFFTYGGGLGKPDITALLENAAQKCIAAGVALGDPMSDTGYVLGQAVQSAAVPDHLNLLDLYAEQLRHMIKEGIKHPGSYDKPLTGLKIAVDAGNGSGGFFATQVGCCYCSQAFFQAQCDMAHTIRCSPSSVQYHAE
eukprot:GHUV01053578.1.p1 GENE.GHUV01053578.1~~GHUV01053578.1.p1  ORF type:complete len:152 (-),score=38.44 GHUV01053578.1:309-764(-)